MSNASFEEIAKALASAKTVAVASHVRPDGDAFGAIIAFALWLKAEGKTVKVWNEDGMLEKFRYLLECDLVTQPPAEPEKLDAFVASRRVGEEPPRHRTERAG